MVSVPKNSLPIFGILETTGTNYSFSIFKIHKQIHKFVSNLRQDREMYLFNDAVSHLEYRISGSWIKYKYAALVEWQQQQKTEVLGEKSVSMPVCPPQVSDGHSSTMTDQRLNHLSNFR